MPYTMIGNRYNRFRVNTITGELDVYCQNNVVKYTKNNLAVPSRRNINSAFRNTYLGGCMR